MNLGTMKTALGRLAGVDSTDPLVDWINAALHEFEDAYPWPFLHSTTQGSLNVGEYGLVLPANFFRVEKLALIPSSTDPTPLPYKPLVQVEEEGWRYGDNTVKGKPQWYTVVYTPSLGVSEPSLYVYPAADVSYPWRLNFEVALADLANDVDIPAIPARYHYTIVEGAAIRALQGESQEGRAVAARDAFEASIERHISRLGNLQSGQFNTVRDVMGYGSSC